jgi:hypothetical protein
MERCGLLAGRGMAEGLEAGGIEGLLRHGAECIWVFLVLVTNVAKRGKITRKRGR